MKIRAGIFGYGNLGRGVECALAQNEDFELCAVFSRRDPKNVDIISKNVPVYYVDKAYEMINDIDVMILCGGSATDLPVQTPDLAGYFNVVDSFDTHAHILDHISKVQSRAEDSNKTAVVSVGWDPGMFSLNRLYALSILPQGQTYTFWGKGVSQGHSDAIRRIEGVKDAKQYTIPIDKALNEVRSGSDPELSTRDKHLRECFVVAQEDADKKRIEKEIVNMPNYFADYDTVVHFISEEEIKEKHSGIPHGGFVIRSGKTGMNNENTHLTEYNIRLDSNPEFTAGVMVAYARAAYRLNKEGKSGCVTAFDIPPVYLCAQDRDDVIRKYL